MPNLCLAIIVHLIDAFCNMRKGRTAKPVPLCTNCVHAHVQYAASGHRAIACTFAGAVRPVTIDVMYCTDYRDRNAAPRMVTIGFTREIEDAVARKRFRSLVEVAPEAGSQSPTTDNQRVTTNG